MPERPSEFPRAPLAGAAYSAGSSRRHPARLVKATDGITLLLIERDGGSALARAAPQAIRREARLGSLPAEIVFPCGWRFETQDHNGLDAALGPGPFRRLHRWEAFHPRLVIAVPVLLALAYAVWRWSVAALVAIAVAATPTALPRAIDDGNLMIIDQAADPSQLSQEKENEVRQVFDRLKTAATESRFGEYRLLFRDIPLLGPNAFAMPGGTVIVTDDLIERFPDEDTIAGVLAHEIAHVAEGHVLEQLYRNAGMQLLVALVFGELGPVLEGAATESEVLLSLAYSRKHEADADRIGVALAARAGFEPDGLVKLLESLDSGEAPQESSWWSTHPAPRERISKIRQHANEAKPQTR